MNNIIAAQLFIHKLKPLLEQNKVVFDPRNQKTRIYIKLKIWTDANGDSGVVMSFHEEGDYD